MVVLMNSHHNKYVDSLLRLNYEVIFEQPLTPNQGEEVIDAIYKFIS